MRIKVVGTVLITLMLMLFFYAYIQKAKQVVLQQLFNQSLVSTNTAYHAITDTYKIVSERHFISLMQKQNVLDVLKQYKYAAEAKRAILRGQLYRLLYKEYEQLKRFNVRQFHFHTVEGETILRLHNPSATGDSLIQDRKSIRLANTELINVDGFEGGKSFPGFRYVFPIFDKNEHLGSVEFSLSFDGVEKQLQHIQPSLAYQLILEKDVSYDKVFKHNRTIFEESTFDKNHYIENSKISRVSQRIQVSPLLTQLTKLVTLSPKFISLLHKQEHFSVPIIFENKGYVVNFFTIRDTSNKVAAHLISFIVLQGIVEIEQNYFIYLLVGWAVIFVLAVMIIVVIFQNKKSKQHKEKLKNLSKLAASLNSAQNLAHLGSWELDLIENKLYWSDEVFSIFGTEAQSFEPDFIVFTESIHPDDRPRVQEVYKTALKQQSSYQVNYRFVRENGSIRSVSEAGDYQFDRKGKAIKKVGTLHDMTEMLAYEKKLFSKLKKVIDIQDSIVVVTNGMKLNFANKKFFDFFGYESLDDFSKDFNCICDRFIKNNGFFYLTDTVEAEQLWIKDLLKLSGRQRIVSMLDKSSVAHAFTVTLNEFNQDHYVINFSDISDSMAEKLQLQKQLIHDPLTKAFNRVYFDKTINHLIDVNKTENKKTGIIFFDIDFFKRVNDTYGHKAGDNVLKKVVSLVKQHIRIKDSLIRWGGEEFIIVCSTETLQDLYKQADYIRSVIDSYQFEEVENISCSFGVATNQEGDDINNTIKRADEKLYQAKTSGRNKVVA